MNTQALWARRFLLSLVFTFTSQLVLADSFETATPALVEEGGRLYANKCTRCHGKNGAGDGLGANSLNPRPRDFKSDIFKFGMEPKQVFNTITNGSPGTGMLGQKERFSDRERWALTHFVLSLRNS